MTSEIPDGARSTDIEPVALVLLNRRILTRSITDEDVEAICQISEYVKWNGMRPMDKTTARQRIATWRDMQKSPLVVAEQGVVLRGPPYLHLIIENGPSSRVNNTSPLGFCVFDSIGPEILNGVTIRSAELALQLDPNDRAMMVRITQTRLIQLLEFGFTKDRQSSGSRGGLQLDMIRVCIREEDHVMIREIQKLMTGMARTGMTMAEIIGTREINPLQNNMRCWWISRLAWRDRDRCFDQSHTLQR